MGDGGTTTMVHTSREGPVVTIRLDRPERRNAIDLAAVGDLQQAVDAARADTSVRVVVLTGAGGHFCAGADLSGVEDPGFVARLGVLLEALRQAAFPTLAAVEGAALGAGTQLALACDLRLATPTARFGIPAGKLGLMVDQPTVRRLALAAGQGAARAMFLAAEVLDGQRAHQLGMVQRLVDRGAVDEVVEDGDGGVDDGGVASAAAAWAAQIARLAPLSVAGHKLGLNEAEDGLGGVGGAVTPAFAAAHARAWASADLAEGLAAFGERRAPRFEGR